MSTPMREEGSLKSEVRQYWCGEHRASKPGLCCEHKVYLTELHDEEIQKIYGIEAIFYCPIDGCDDFDWDDKGGTHNVSRYFVQNRVYGGNDWCHYAISPELAGVIFETFRNAARVKVWHVKERERKLTEERACVHEKYLDSRWEEVAGP